jgi:hypothetical protein
MRAASVVVSIFEEPIRADSFGHRRVRSADEHGRRLEVAQLAQRNPTQAAGEDVCKIAELEVAFGGVDACAERGSPFPAPSGDVSFAACRGGDGHGVTDPDGGLDGLIEQGERTFGLLEREPPREEPEAETERGVDAGGARDADSFFDGGDRGVEPPLGELERGCEHDERVREFVGIRSCPRQPSKPGSRTTVTCRRPRRAPRGGRLLTAAP